MSGSAVRRFDDNDARKERRYVEAVYDSPLRRRTARVAVPMLIGTCGIGGVLAVVSFLLGIWTDPRWMSVGWVMVTVMSITGIVGLATWAVQGDHID